MDKDDSDKQSLSGTTLASSASTFSANTIVPSSVSDQDTQLEHRFYKGNGLSSKATLRSFAGKEYLLVADIHKSKTSTMQMFAGKAMDAAPLGTLAFRHTYNNFQIDLGGHMIQVRARVGHPHPSSYSFTLPAASSATQAGSRTVVWKAFGPRSNVTGYHLYEEGTNFLIASWQLSPKEKHQAVLRWHVDPGDEMLENAVVLSYIGGLTRLKLKGKDDSERGSGLARWNGMWFMAILGSAAVA